MQTLQDIKKSVDKAFDRWGYGSHRDDILMLTEAGKWNDIFSDCRVYNNAEVDTLVDRFQDADLSAKFSDEDVYNLILLVAISVHISSGEDLT